MTVDRGPWLADASEYDRLRRRTRAGDPSVAAAARELRLRAEALCRTPAPAVTDKLLQRHAPSRNPHDYVSIGTYWWPNPASPDGLPYVQRDGELSSELELYDRPRWDRAADGMVTTAKAAYFLDQPQFAQEAANRLRRWFLDPGTRMSPHACHAQMIPGRHAGSPLGLIDFALYLPTVLDHLQGLSDRAGSPWSEPDQAAMDAWCAEFLAWLETHPFGRREEAAANNHGVYYDFAEVAHRMPADFVSDAFPMVEPLHPFGQRRSPEET